MKTMFSFFLLSLFIANIISSQQKKMHPIFLCGKSISEFSKCHDVHFLDDPENQLLKDRGEVINHFQGRRNEIEKCLRGGL
jgi:hypothetical protein